MEGDSEAVFAHFALQRLHKFPNELMALGRAERAFVYASIGLRAEAEERELNKLKS